MDAHSDLQRQTYQENFHTSIADAIIAVVQQPAFHDSSTRPAVNSLGFFQECFSLAIELSTYPASFAMWLAWVRGRIKRETMKRTKLVNHLRSTLSLRQTYLALLTGLLVLTSGCATIVTGPTRKVAVSSDPEGAKVIVVDRKGRTVAEGTTPFTAKLAKGELFRPHEYTFTFSKDGYADARQDIKGTINGWYFGNLVFGGLIGLVVVDPLTGAMYTLPKGVTVNLSPKTAASPREAHVRIVDLRQIPQDMVPHLIRFN